MYFSAILVFVALYFHRPDFTVNEIILVWHRYAKEFL